MPQSDEIVSDAVEPNQASDAFSDLLGLLIELQIIDPPTEIAPAELNFVGSNADASVLLPAATQHA